MVESVDSDRNHRVAPVKLLDRLDDVVTRSDLLIGRDGVLKIEHHLVGCRRRCLLHHLETVPRGG
jgi:hypothetical protein